MVNNDGSWWLTMMVVLTVGVNRIVRISLWKGSAPWGWHWAAEKWNRKGKGLQVHLYSQQLNHSWKWIINATRTSSSGDSSGGSNFNSGFEMERVNRYFWVTCMATNFDATFLFTQRKPSKYDKYSNSTTWIHMVLPNVGNYAAAQATLGQPCQFRPAPRQGRAPSYLCSACLSLQNPSGHRIEPPGWRSRVRLSSLVVSLWRTHCLGGWLV